MTLSPLVCQALPCAETATLLMGRAEPWHDKLHSPGSPRAGACQLVGETRFWAGWLCDQGSPGLALGWKWLGPRSADCRACSVLRLMLAHWWAGKPLSQKERTPDWSILFICFETVMLMQSQSWDDYRVMPHCFPMSWEQQCERNTLEWLPRELT